MFPPRRTALLAVALLLAAAPLRAAEPPRGWLNPLRYRDLALDAIHKARMPEAAEMLLAVATGSEMGPGEGWFHPGQGRYGWSWLATHFDKNGDGKITREEFAGPADLFDRLDRDGDGVLTAADFDWSERSPYHRLGMMAGQWFAFLDGNGNGRVSKEEWDAFFKKAAGNKGYLTPEDLRRVMQPPKPPEGQKGGPTPLVLFRGLFNGELGSFHEGPAVGDAAPDFRLWTPDGQTTYSLGDYRGKKPVVLIFGSFT
jgi:hypothetical protein